MSESKKRRIKGEAFWKIHGFLKSIEDAQEALKKWTDDRAKELGKYRDQINWQTGLIYDPMVEIVDGRIVRGKSIARVPDAMMDEYNAKLDSLRTIDRDLGDYRDQLARRIGVFPQDIDLKTGEVSPADFEELEELAAKE